MSIPPKFLQGQQEIFTWETVGSQDRKLRFHYAFSADKVAPHKQRKFFPASPLKRVKVWTLSDSDPFSLTISAPSPYILCCLRQQEKEKKKKNERDRDVTQVDDGPNETKPEIKKQTAADDPPR